MTPLESHFEKSNFYGFVITERGGANPCTWFHEDVAIEFARWLSPMFAVWCNDRIREILTCNVSKYPTTIDEAIFYGYEKALEKICRQGKLIKKYSKCITELKSKLDYEKEKREQKRIDMQQKVVEDVKEWIDSECISGMIKLSTLHMEYFEWCSYHSWEFVSSRKLCSILRLLGYKSTRKKDGLYFIIEKQ